ncbi:MAG: glycosyltransferase [Candidatus Firestonebacteria bacterium]
MNIGIFTDDYLPSVDGAVTSIITFAKEFKKLGHTVYIIAPEYPNYTDEEKNIIRLKSIPAPFPPKYRWCLSWLVNLEEKLKGIDLDIIHIQSPFPVGFLGIKEARKRKIPIVNTYHTLYPAYILSYMTFLPKWAGKIVEKYSAWACNKSDLIISPSPQMKDALVEYGVTAKIEVLPTGIDLEKLLVKSDADDFKKKYKIGSDERILLFMGRLGREKNVEFLIKALPKIIEKVPNVRLVISGEGVAKDEILNTAKSLGVIDKVLLLGFLSHNDWINAYGAAELFTFASLTETQGLVLLEAMALNTPVVAVGAMGVLDVMKNERGGLLSKVDTNDFADKVVKILTDKELYQRKLKEAKELALEMSSKTMSDKLLALYEGLLKK